MGETAGLINTNCLLVPFVLTTLKSSVCVCPAKLATTVLWYRPSRSSKRAVHSGTHMGTIEAAHGLAEVPLTFAAPTLGCVVAHPSIPGGIWNMSHTFFANAPLRPVAFPAM